MLFTPRDAVRATVAALAVCAALLICGCANRPAKTTGNPPPASASSEKRPSSRPGIPWTTLGANGNRDSFTRETFLWPLAKKPLWRKRIDNKDLTDGYTILMKDDRVFVGTSFGTFLCLNAETGERVWRTTLLSPYTKEPPARARLPSIVGNLVVMGDVLYTAYALDVASGEVRWTMRVSRQSGFSASAVGNEEVVAIPCRDGALYLRDAATGDPRGGFIAKSDLMGDPILVGNTCWVGSNDHGVYGVNVKTGRLDTIFEAAGAVQEPIVYSDGRLFATDSESYLYCIGADDGRMIWRREMPLTNGALFPGVWRSYVLMQGKDLALHVMRAQDGKDVHVLPLKGVAMGAPIGTPNKIVVVTSLFPHIDPLGDPKSVKRFASLGEFKMIQGHKLFVVDRSWIYVIDPQSWSIDEVREFGKHQAAYPALAYGKLVIENGDGYLEAYGDSSRATTAPAP